MTDILPMIQSFVEPWSLFLAEDPMLRLLQGVMLLAGLLVVFLVFFATRDILLRTHSFFLMVFVILLVAGLPVVGFFLYLLIRPSRTLKERETEALLKEILVELKKTGKNSPAKKKSAIVKKKTTKKTSEDLSL